VLILLNSLLVLILLTRGASFPSLARSCTSVHLALFIGSSVLRQLALVLYALPVYGLVHDCEQVF
jgi:hypothetical protein